MSVFNGYLYNPLGTHTRNTSLGTAVTLTPPTGANILRLQALTHNIRYTLDGSTTATATVGFRLAAGAEINLPVPSGKTVSVIQETSGAEIQYQWAVMIFAGGNVPAR